jgi:hypothetical protein
MSDTYFIATESADERNLPMCKEIAEYLAQAYPGYPWHVRIDGGMLIIKNLRISTTWSMARKFSSIAHDAKARKQEVVRAAGEFLEAANLRRDHATGENAKVLEGRKDDKPFSPLIEVKEITL